VLHLVALAEEGVFQVGSDIFYVDARVMVESVKQVLFISSQTVIIFFVPISCCLRRQER
jgi:hypothetical protein